MKKAIVMAIGSFCIAGVASATNVENNNGQHSNKQHQTQSQLQVQNQTQASKVSNKNAINYSSPQSVTNEAKRIPASSATAAGLAASNGTCMGSASGGVQGMSLGVSVGSTYKDEDCNRRYNAQHLMALGKEKAALALMCQDPTVAEAIKASGDSCPKVIRSTMETRKAEVEYTDPIIRHRLGLAPL